MSKAKEISLTQDLLHELLDYDGSNLIWKVNRGTNKTKGEIAGCTRKGGYRRIAINKRKYQAHRLLWIYHYGSIDKDLDIDHINGDKRDNSIENLRLITHQENHFNRTTAKGYCWNKAAKKWRAQIQVDYKKITLGFYNTEQDARNAYLQAKAMHHIIKEHNA